MLITYEAPRQVHKHSLKLSPPAFSLKKNLLITTPLHRFFSIILYLKLLFNNFPLFFINLTFDLLIIIIPKTKFSININGFYFFYIFKLKTISIPRTIFYHSRIYKWIFFIQYFFHFIININTIC